MSRHHLLLSLSVSTTILMLAWPAPAQEASPAPAPAAQSDETAPPAEPAPKPVVLDPLTVTGTKVPTPKSEVPATIDVITQEDLDRLQPMTVGDALDNLPGVEVEGGPKGSQAQPNIRGFGGTGWGTNRVVTTLDGARQDVGAAHGGSMFYDPELIKQVEVLKGTGSTLYGSGAIGGVIALTTKDAADYLEGDDKYGFRTKAGYHSNNTEPMVSQTFAWRPNGFVDFLGNYTWRTSGDYNNGDGDPIKNTSVDVHNGLMKLGINPAEGHRLELSGILFSDDEDITATDVNNANREYAADHRIRKNTESAHYTFDSPTSDLVNLSATVYRDHTEVTDDGKDYDRVSTAELTTTGADIFNTFDFETGWAQHAFTIGTEYYHDAGKGRVNGEKEGQNPDASQDVVGIYAQYRMTFFDQLSITPGVRWDYYATNPEGGDFENRHNDRFSPKVGVDWQPLEWITAFGSYSQGYRAPSIRELYISGTHFAIGGPLNNVFVPNPDLKPESTQTWEGGLRFAFDDVVMEGDGLRINGSYFDTRAKNFIDGSVVMDFIPPTQFTTTPVNVPRAHIRGAEIELAYDSEYAFFSGGWSRIRGDSTGDDAPLTSIPADKLFVTVGAKVPQLDVFFGFTDEYAWAQNRNLDPTLRTDDYNVVGLFAGWAPDEGLLKGFRVDAGIDNVFSKQYQRYLALEDAPGRDYRVALSYGASF
ncbi:TonB-dependent hemoglobin/transferrin/lactoferrin family receptor [Dongia sedimenti]|uniref:TonB-dependent hemoglobin/transferrin/lactoferrin family receptor n=1 Tax=Dongia sedimenti TaxID=3064282 RepID=A0ABU0YHX3_9PROT|nr:TonB-dependent hemoglobin/transferrin/lactoferrin family receptor [Rhodospirillaceae bacterium R-7]